MDLKKYVQIQGPQRNPILGIPHMTFDDDYQSIEAVKERQLQFRTTLIGSQYKKSPQKKSPLQKKDEQGDEDTESDLEQIQDGSKEILPFQKALDWKRKDDRIFNHILKCFTFGKKIKRQLDDDGEKISRVEILKKRFQRLSLLREYFSVQNRNRPRKFKYPVCEDANQIQGDPFSIYDELQYCEESDIEDQGSSRKKKKSRISTNIKDNINNDLEERSESLDLDYIDNSKRFDHKLIKHLAKKLIADEDRLNEKIEIQPSEPESDDTLEGLSNSDSVCSTPRKRIEKELLQFDRLMPFDFYTHRKAKKFFKEPIMDIDILLNDYKQSIKHKDLFGQSKLKGQNLTLNTSSRGTGRTGRSILKKEKIYFDDNEDAKLRELPEMNDDLKEMYQIYPQPLQLQKQQQKTPNSIGSQFIILPSERITSSFENYNYTQTVQASQVRNAYSELQGFVFNRAQNKSLKSKRELLEKVVQFKQSIQPSQINALKARQFVIIEMNPPERPNQKAKKADKKNVSQIQRDQLPMKQSDLPPSREMDQIMDVKYKILKEKDKMVKFKLFEKSFSNKYHLSSQKTNTTASSTLKSLAQLKQANSQTQLQMNQNGSSSQIRFLTRPTIIEAPVEQTPPQEKDDDDDENHPPPQKDLKTLLETSPYMNILEHPETFGLGITQEPPRKQRKFMLEKLKRRSILNCELFKETGTKDSKPKTLYMTERINKVIASPMVNLVERVSQKRFRHGFQ